jgi:HK97 gp10 family phage protein
MSIDIAQTLADLAALESRIRAEVHSALVDGAEVARRAAIQTTAWKDRTGAARNSIQHIDAGEFRQRVQAGGRLAPHVKFLEEGTKAHVIAARRARFLRFVQNGAVRFAKRVNHPGTKPTGFMKAARDEAEVATVRFVEAGINRAIG